MSKKAIIAGVAIRYLYALRNVRLEARAFCREWIAIRRMELAGAVA